MRKWNQFTKKFFPIYKREISIEYPWCFLIFITPVSNIKYCPLIPCSVPSITGFLSKLRDADKNEVNLLTPLMDNRSKTLMKAIDHTNNKYGRHAITIASAGIHKGWKMRREHSSKIDTASFNYLPKVSAS